MPRPAKKKTKRKPAPSRKPATSRKRRKPAAKKKTASRKKSRPVEVQKKRGGRPVRRGRRPVLRGIVVIDRNAYEELRLFCKEFEPLEDGSQHPQYVNVVGKLLGQIPVILSDAAIAAQQRTVSTVTGDVPNPYQVAIDSKPVSAEAPDDPLPMAGEQSELVPVNL